MKNLIKDITVIFIVTLAILQLAIGFVGIQILNSYNSMMFISNLINSYFTVSGWMFFMTGHAMIAILIALICALILYKGK